MYKKFLNIADACRTLNNFNSLFAIYCGLTSNAIHRLKSTKALIGSKYEKKFEEFKEVTYCVINSNPTTKCMVVLFVKIDVHFMSCIMLSSLHIAVLR